MNFYTVDRGSLLTPYTTCNLTIYKDINPSPLQEHVDLMFPDGLSRHGNQYFLNAKSIANSTNSMLELVFEYVRRANDCTLPSRFQSMFAVDSVEMAKRFRNDFNTPQAPIYRVKSNLFTKADMSLLKANSNLWTSYLANLYWSGAENPNAEPFWEYLLRCPVEIFERVA